MGTDLILSYHCKLAQFSPSAPFKVKTTMMMSICDVIYLDFEILEILLTFLYLQRTERIQKTKAPNQIHTGKR